MDYRERLEKAALAAFSARPDQGMDTAFVRARWLLNSVDKACLQEKPATPNWTCCTADHALKSCPEVKALVEAAEHALFKVQREGDKVRLREAIHPFRKETPDGP